MPDFKTEIVNSLSKALSDARSRAKLSQNEVARRMGLKPDAHNFVSRLEQGRIQNPGLRTILRFLESCGVRLDQVRDRLAGLSLPVEPVTARIGSSGKVVVEPVKTEPELRQDKKHNQLNLKKAMLRILRAEVMTAIGPLLHGPAKFRLGAYEEEARLLFGAWRLAMRLAKGKDPRPLMKKKFDEVLKEPATGLDPKLVEVVRRICEAKFESWMR